ncbi:MAG: PilZ domain-containing protein [Magnetococcus sp. DMHC-8]
MAEAGTSSGKGLFGLFKKKAPEESAVSAPPKEGVIDSVAEMVPLLVTVLEEKFPVRVLLGNSSFSYYTHFEWELVENELGKILESKNYLEEGRFLLLAPLDPPIGNLKIRSASEVRVEFASKFHLLEGVSTLERITPARKICLAFPKNLRQKPQQRLAVRTPVARNMEIVASVVRPSGIVFEAKFRDISSGGVAFYPTGATPTIADHSRVQMTITYPAGKVAVEAVVLGAVSKDGEQIFRTQFLVDSHQVSLEINALVSYVQRENIVRRKELLR